MTTTCPRGNRKLVTTLVVFMLVACTSETEPAPQQSPSLPVDASEYQAPEQVRNATYVWSAEPGIDLLDNRGKLIRASHESMMIAFYGGIETTYPGFSNAIDPRYARRINTIATRALVGTIRAHLLQVHQTEKGFNATVCIQPSHYAVRRDDGQYHTVHGSAIEERVEFNHPTAEDRDLARVRPNVPPSTTPRPPSPPIADATHQWSAPTEDVFAGTEWLISFGADLGDAKKRCEEWGRSIEPGVPDDGAEFLVSPTPPETLPAYPGW